jgi:hypothetical protein
LAASPGNGILANRAGYRQNITNVDVTKDRQEKAIYVFTLVNIIFLPLSAVSSIFGMNTADIRDTELGQWAYWAAALPLTLTVIVVGLWWMGEFGNFVDWLRGPARFRAVASIPPGVKLANLPAYGGGLAPDTNPFGPGLGPGSWGRSPPYYPRPHPPLDLRRPREQAGVDW